MKPTIRIRSIMMGFLASDTRRSLGHLLGRLQRSAGPTVHYFHQVDDPYSHIAVQKLDTLRSRYQVQFNCHLVPSPTPAFQGDSERFAHWALRDARTIASYYGACLPDAIDQIDPEQTAIAAAELASLLASDQFADRATKLGNSLWSNETLPASDFPDAPHHIESGGKLREKLGHYLGAMFYFEGEWYWGVDRLYHLEHRLIAMGYCNKPDAPICVQRPAAESATGKNAKEITLEYFPSLRSPYTAISFDRTIDLVQRSGVQLKLRPVMPMMMRGIPAPRAKQMYIITDTKREAEAAGVPFGRIVDPFGDPVIRAFSLFPYLAEQGKDVDFASAYLRGAWAEGIDITTDDGIRIIAESVGINWHDAEKHLGSSQWQAVLEHNVNDMLNAGLWGVPSFRVTGGNNAEPFCCWGQDRLWRVETEISLRANSE